HPRPHNCLSFWVPIENSRQLRRKVSWGRVRAEYRCLKAALVDLEPFRLVVGQYPENGDRLSAHPLTQFAEGPRCRSRVASAWKNTCWIFPSATPRSMAANGFSSRRKTIAGCPLRSRRSISSPREASAVAAT